MINYLFSQSRIVKGIHSLKKQRSPITTSRGFPAEIVNIPKALPGSPEMLQLSLAHNK